MKEKKEKTVIIVKRRGNKTVIENDRGKQWESDQIGGLECTLGLVLIRTLSLWQNFADSLKETVKITMIEKKYETELEMTRQGQGLIMENDRGRIWKMRYVTGLDGALAVMVAYTLRLWVEDADDSEKPIKLSISIERL